MSAILLDQKNLLEQYLNLSSGQLSAFSFVNLFTWKDFFRFDLKIIDHNLCVFAHNESGTFLYLPPLGEQVTPQTIEQCFQVMEEANGPYGVTRIENVPQQWLYLYEPQKYSFYPKGDEYVYDKNDIISLKGNRYKSKRSSYNQFVKNHAYTYIPFEPDMTRACLALYEKWALARREKYNDDIYAQMLDENRLVHALVMRYYNELNSSGRVVLVQGKIAAYTFGFPLGSGTFCVLLEITDPDIKGLPVFIFRHFCQDPQLEKFRFINVMDDFAMDNIGRTKKSYHPHHLLKSYVIKKRKNF